jgi:glycosyltransferase involved in cell wall biosynthesis
MSLPERTVCLDAQGAQSRHHHDRGIARYITEHVRALHQARPESLHSVVLNPTLHLPGSLNWLLGSNLLGWATADRRVQRAPRRPPAIYHVMSPFELEHPIDELWPQWARASDVRTVVTLYDLIPLVFADHYLRDPAIRARYEARSTLVQRADHVLAISHTTAEDAIDRLGIRRDRITVINAGATQKFADMYNSPNAAGEILRTRLPAIRSGYILYVAGFEFRKNLERIITAYGLLARELREAHQLVIACRMLPSEEDLLREWAIRAEIQDEQLVVTGYVSDEELGALYHACDLFVFASIYEGSGLPILEAMSCGAPVVASNTSTGPEILGGLQGTFDPYEPTSIAECLTRVISSPLVIEDLVQRSRRRVAAYSWAAVGQRSLEAYEGVLNDRPLRAARPRRRPRIALASPWPPEQSGIADYNLRLARELGQHVDVDVVVGKPLGCYAPPLERGVRLLTTSSFEETRRLRQPDRIVYCMGNSAFHGHVYELLRQHPGAVVAHDVRLTGFFGWFAEKERPDDPAGRLAERMESLYGHRLPAAVAGGGIPNWELQAALGIYMTGEIQQYAEQMLVHSRHALEVLELDRGPLDRSVPVQVLPFAMPLVVSSRPHRSLEDSPMLVSVGVISEVKGLASLITAIALLAERYPHIRLIIAGPGAESEISRWRDFAAEVASGVNIEVTGHLSTEAYASLLARADLAVQLRTISHGEASAAVADCLAAGLPTVVSDLGWASELPAGAVWRVPLGAAPAALATRLEELIRDEDARHALSEAAQAHAKACDFSSVAEAYLRVLELA